MKISELRQIIREALEDQVKECPTATQDLRVKTANRDRAMQRFYKQSQKGNVSLDRMDRMFLGKKDQGEIAKNNQKIRSYNRTVLAKKIVKNLLKLRKL